SAISSSVASSAAWSKMCARVTLRTEVLPFLSRSNRYSCSASLKSTRYLSPMVSSRLGHHLPWSRVYLSKFLWSSTSIPTRSTMVRYGVGPLAGAYHGTSQHTCQCDAASPCSTRCRRLDARCVWRDTLPDSYCSSRPPGRLRAYDAAHTRLTRLRVLRAPRRRLPRLLVAG